MSKLYSYNAIRASSWLDLEPTEVVLRRLRLHSEIGPSAAAALVRLLGPSRQFAAGELISQAGEPADVCTVVQDGLACRMTVLADGRRQIHALLVPGDTADAEAPLLPRRTDNVEALTACSVFLIPKSRLAGLLVEQPQLAEAFAREAALGAQVAREWVVNIGRRTALERLAHLICELYARLAAVGLASDYRFAQPLTQQELADAEGLSTVHVNRVLQDLRARGLIAIKGRQVTILDAPALKSLALFEPLYLHLPTFAA